jgi:hypothetical protein
MRFVIAATVILSIGCAFAAPASAQNCTTTQNPFTRALETHCSDGSYSTSTRNPFTGSWDTTTQPGFQAPSPYPQPMQQPRHCTTTQNPFTRALETRCW